MSDFDIEKLKNADAIGADLGEEIFNHVSEKATELSQGGMPDALVNAAVRVAIQMSAASLVAYMISHGTGKLKHEQVAELARTVHDRISKVISETLLENGAKLVSIDIP